MSGNVTTRDYTTCREPVVESRSGEQRRSPSIRLDEASIPRQPGIRPKLKLRECCPSKTSDPAAFAARLQLWQGFSVLPQQLVQQLRGLGIQPHEAHACPEFTFALGIAVTDSASQSQLEVRAAD